MYPPFPFVASAAAVRACSLDCSFGDLILHRSTALKPRPSAGMSINCYRDGRRCLEPSGRPDGDPSDAETVRRIMVRLGAAFLIRDLLIPRLDRPRGLLHAHRGTTSAPAPSDLHRALVAETLKGLGRAMRAPVSFFSKIDPCRPRFPWLRRRIARPRLCAFPHRHWPLVFAPLWRVRCRRCKRPG